MTISMPLRRILFVCRGSTRDGLGHVTRTRAVAQSMSRLAVVRVLVIGDQYVESLLRDRGLRFEVHPDETFIASYIGEFAPDVVVLDALQFSEATISVASSCSMTVSLSPVFNHLNDVDLVFHRTKFQGDDWDFSQPNSPELRCSLDYAVVRENCVRITDQEFEDGLKQERLAIAVSMGGADAGNKTLNVLRALSIVSSPLLIWTLLGEGYAHSYEPLVECVRENNQHEIILAKTNDSMWRVLRTCSLAVLAGGTVTYEAAFAGLPSINLFENSRHVFLINELVDRGVCISAGYPMDGAVDVAAANVAQFEAKRSQLSQMHQATNGLIDGKAGRRISEEILDHYWVRQLESDSSEQSEDRNRVEHIAIEEGAELAKDRVA